MVGAVGRGPGAPLVSGHLQLFWPELFVDGKGSPLWRSSAGGLNEPGEVTNDPRKVAPKALVSICKDL